MKTTYRLAFMHRNPFTMELLAMELTRDYATLPLARAAARRRNKSGKGDRITMIVQHYDDGSTSCCSVD